jgi:hypothetical protein
MRVKKYDENTKLEIHHIVPKHAGGTEEKSNKILLSLKDHTWAHLFRYFQYGQLGDCFAYLMRQNSNEDIAKLRTQYIIEKNKENKILFWDPIWQSKQGLKGGQKGGRAKTERQYQARQKVGQKYGKKVGISRQKPELKEHLKREWCWIYKESQNEVWTKPCETFTDLVDQLNKQIPGSIKNVTSFIKVFYGERKQLYGWKLIKD